MAINIFLVVAIMAMKVAYPAREFRVRFPIKRGGAARRQLAGTDNRRIVSETVRDGVERVYHATKGWRTRRIAPAAKAPR